MKAISLDEVQAILREVVLRKEAEVLPVLDCADRILAEDIYTVIDQPPFRRSARDGYAVRSTDTKGASREQPIRLKVADWVYAGTNEEKILAPQEAVRIMTGGMLPEEADCVIMQEDTDYGNEIVSIYRELQPGDYYSPIGEEFKIGTRIAAAGTKADANIIATAVAGGLLNLPVRQKVKAAVITTGDELCVLREERKRGQIYPSNMAYLSTRLKQLGCEVVCMSQPIDRLDTITEAIKEALEKADVVITTGGVSVGAKDYLESAVEQAGAKVLSHGIAVNPGRPSMVAMYKNKPIISLTGTPFSAGIVFELLIHPILSAMLGTDELELHHIMAVAQEDFQTSKKHSRQFIRGYYHDGKVYRVNHKSKSQNFAGIGSNCLIDLPEEVQKLDCGDKVNVYLII